MNRQRDGASMAKGPGRASPPKRARGRRRTGGRGAPAVERPSRRVHPRNALNDLTGEEWLFFTRSVIQTAYRHELGHDLRKAHGANKPPQLMRSLIEFFTKGGERVLDPFAGVGGTLIGAALAGRRATGIEINPRWAEVYQAVCERERIEEQELLVGDALELLEGLEGPFDMVATDPPYNLTLERTMCDGKYPNANRRTDYSTFSDDPKDLSNLPTYEAYLDAMQRVLGECRRLLRPGRYAVLIVRDAYQDGRYIMTHADLARRGEEAGLVLKGETIWYQAGTRLRPYGYPYAYVPNIAHQHILVLRKE
jgi:DNA modification methylase